MISFDGLTIAICTRNRPEDLKRCVNSIANSVASLSEDIEVIIIDDGNLTKQCIHNLAVVLPPFVRFNYHKKYKPGLLLSRIEALSIASHQIILFLDDDVEIDGNYCKVLIDTYKNSPDVAGVGGIDVLMRTMSGVRRALGYVFCLNSGDRAKRSISQFGDSMIYWNRAESYFETSFLSGCNMSFRKTALKQLLAVDWLQNYSLGEDVFLSYFAKRQGRLIINPQLKVCHHQAAVSRDKIRNVAYMEIVNSYHLMEFDNAKGWHYLVLLWSSLGKIISCGVRDDKVERLSGYVKGILAVLKLLIKNIKCAIT